MSGFGWVWLGSAGFNQDSAGVPLWFCKDAAGVPLGFRLGFAGVPLGFRWVLLFSAVLRYVLLESVGLYSAELDIYLK